MTKALAAALAPLYGEHRAAFDADPAGRGG
jgi:hypothetical protein